MATNRAVNSVFRVAHGMGVVIGALFFTLAFFLVLPLMQTISKAPTNDMIVTPVDAIVQPPPPPPPEEEKKKEEEPEDKPPELQEEQQQIDLSQLELALDPTLSGDFLSGDMAVSLNSAAAQGSDVDALFSLSDLDQAPRAIYQPSPTLNAQLRKRAPGTVYIIFIVDQRGRVENPIVQSSTDPIFEGPALSAVKQWKFEPGKRNGNAVRFRMRVPITFPKGS